MLKRNFKPLTNQRTETPANECMLDQSRHAVIMACVIIRLAGWQVTPSLIQQFVREACRTPEDSDNLDPQTSLHLRLLIAAEQAPMSAEQVEQLTHAMTYWLDVHPSLSLLDRARVETPILYVLEGFKAA